MHHAVPQGTIVPWGTAFRSAILRPPEVKSCRIYLVRSFKESMYCWKTVVIYLVFKYFQRILRTQVIHLRAFEFYCAFYKDNFALFKPGYSPEK